MKRPAFTLDLGKYRKWLQQFGHHGRGFLLLSVCTLSFFLTLAIASLGQSKLQTSPVASMKGIAAHLSNEFFIDLLGLEVPHMREQKSTTVFSGQHVFGFVFRMLTDINPQDPKTLLSHEVAGLGLDSSILLRKPPGAAIDPWGPQDYPPDLTVSPGGGLGTDGSGGIPISPTPTATPEPNVTTSPKPEESPDTVRKAVLIYHTHNQESWVSELGLSPKEANKAHDKEINITLVGKRLKEQLEAKGIGVVHYTTDYSSTEKDYNWYRSYNYSRKTVQEALAANRDIEFVFDLHRDDSQRDQAVLEANGTTYARVFFVIGQKNKNWQQNEAFAAKLQEELEAILPGISRGIWAKKTSEGNAEYNQSLSPNSILIEVGSVHNTLDEAYRTADVLAEAIANLYWKMKEADKV